MMVVLFRSLRLGLLSMVPLSITILGVYGAIGWIGKDYDMPIAVLSSLTLGMSVDFAIHFIERMRGLAQTSRSFAQTVEKVFEEPARAITRNVIVIAFPVLHRCSLPRWSGYIVGAFMAAIMVRPE
jgi:predicted RND superfamily exporter protein